MKKGGNGNGIETGSADKEATRKTLEKMHRDRLPARLDRDLKRTGEKGAGLSSGYQSEYNESKTMVKTTYKILEPSLDKGKTPGTIGKLQRERAEFENELIAGEIARRVFLYDRAPQIAIASSQRTHSPNPSSPDGDIAVRSRFLPNSTTLKDFVGVQVVRGSDGRSTITDTGDPNKAKQVEGMEKVIALSLILGDGDWHYENVMIVKEPSYTDGTGKTVPERHVAARIDWGLSLYAFRDSYEFFQEMWQTYNNYYVNLGPALSSINVELQPFAAAMEQAVMNAKAADIDAIIDAKAAEIAEHSGGLSQESRGQIEEKRVAIKNNIAVAEQVSKTLNVMAKMEAYKTISSGVVQKVLPPIFEGAKWMNVAVELAKNAKDPVLFALENGYFIEGKHPLAWAAENAYEIGGKPAISYLLFGKDAGKPIAMAEDSTVPAQYKITQINHADWMKKTIIAAISTADSREVASKQAAAHNILEGLFNAYYKGTNTADKASMLSVYNDVVKFRNEKVAAAGGKTKLKALPELKNDSDMILYAIENKYKIGGKDPINYAGLNNIKIAGKDALIYGIENNHKIDGLEVLEFVALRNFRVAGKEAILYALDNKRTVGGLEPIEYAARKNIKISGQDPIIYTINNNLTIGQKDPVTFAVENKIKIRGIDPLLYAHRTGSTVAGQQAIEWFVKNQPYWGIAHSTATDAEKKEFAAALKVAIENHKLVGIRNVSAIRIHNELDKNNASNIPDLDKLLGEYVNPKTTQARKEEIAKEYNTFVKDIAGDKFLDSKDPRVAKFMGISSFTIAHKISVGHKLSKNREDWDQLYEDTKYTASIEVMAKFHRVGEELHKLNPADLIGHYWQVGITAIKNFVLGKGISTNDIGEVLQAAHAKTSFVEAVKSGGGHERGR